MTNVATVKDPDAVLDYKWDWSDWLAGDTIIDHEMIAGGVTVASSAATTTAVTAWVTGGKGRCSVTCRITTAAGRIDDRTMWLSVRDR